MVLHQIVSRRSDTLVKGQSVSIFAYKRGPFMGEGPKAEVEELRWIQS